MAYRPKLNSIISTKFQKILLIIGLCIWTRELAAYEVNIISDSSIAFLDPNNAGESAQFPFELQADGSRKHIIRLDQPAGYRKCRINYRQAQSVRVRWEPPQGFSKFSAKNYDIILSIIQPSILETDGVTVRLETPKGYSRLQLDQYEKTQKGDGLSSIKSFFTTALLARHFAHALPEGHGKTKRMVNASVDHLVEANWVFENVTIQPGWEYERFVEQNTGSGVRADKAIHALQGMNVAFFRDIKPAFRKILDGNQNECKEGLELLKELSRCHDDIRTEAPALLSEVANVLNSHDPNISGAKGFDFGKRIDEAEAICQAKQ